MTQLSGIAAPGGNETPQGTWPPEIPPPAGPRSFGCGGCPSEDDIAEDVLNSIYEDYRYATDLRRWIMRDGSRWVPAPDGITPVVAACAAATHPATDLDRPDYRKLGLKRGGWESGQQKWYTRNDILADELARKLKTTAAQSRLAALMRSKAPAVTDWRGTMAVRADQLDGEPHILWAGSVPFDLARSVTEPVWARGDYDNDEGCQAEDEPYPMTWPHMLSCNYCPDIRIATPVWDELTAAIFPDVNEREHALNALAHGLHGYPTEAAILARSATGTGKSFLASLISDLLGDYAGQVAAKTLFGNGGNSQFAFNEMAGARFVVMNEGRKADFASTEAFKAVVGPDPLVNARGRHERTGRRIPAHHTMFLTVNPAADLDYADPAVVRRLIPAGFAGNPRKIKAIAARYGTNSAEGLAAWRAEAPGVLAKMIVRCAYVLGDPAYRGTRADTPESVQSRFDAVAAEADPFGRWFTERTAEGCPTPNDDLLEDYQRWCKAHHEVAVAPTWFGRALASRGVERARTGHGRGWRIALRS